MKKTYEGACHCRAVRFSCELDLEAGTTRCNCGFCQRARFWMVFAKASEMRILAGAENLTDYQFVPEGMTEPFLHFKFCRTCGVRPFTEGGELAQFGGAFFAVNVVCLDVGDEVLDAIPVKYADGRHGAWENVPALHGYL